MKKIAIIGIGKLGLCFGLNLSKVGYSVTGIDINDNYIKSLQEKTFISDEPLVNEYLKEYSFDYTTDLTECLKSDLIFVVVNTPSTSDDKYDHNQIDVLIDRLLKFNISERRDLVINCTTFPGYCNSLQEKLKNTEWKVSYNPEFIAQGSIIRDQQNCDMVLIGEYDKLAGDKIESVYRSFTLSNPVINKMSVTEAELTKLSLNCFLTTKITFANMIGDISNRLSCDSSKVLNAIGGDSRVGNKYLKYGFGYGGPCFPRDNRALVKCASDNGIDALISKATDSMNKLHLEYQVDDFVHKNPNKDEPIHLEYITYKKDSVSLEESQQHLFAKSLVSLGYKVIIMDERDKCNKI